MKKSTLLILAIVLVIVIGLLLYFVTRQKSPKEPEDNQDTVIELPINTLELSQRPFLTLAPDSTGRSLNMTLSGAPVEGVLEYEMIYNASGKQEGALGSIFLDSEKQPITKAILLGSKSGGGKVTYHEGVTGGSITLTYAEVRLKESWNYLHFDVADPTFSSTDAKFRVELGKTALKDDSVIITMKTFGYPKTGLPEESAIITGPYGYFTQTPVKGSSTVTLTLPAGDHVEPTIYEWSGTTWKKLATTLTGETVTATATGNVFVVVTQ